MNNSLNLNDLKKGHVVVPSAASGRSRKPGRTKRRVEDGANRTSVETLVANALANGDMTTIQVLVSTYSQFISSLTFISMLYDTFQATPTKEVRANIILLLRFWIESRFCRDFTNKTSGKGNKAYTQLLLFFDVIEQHGCSLNEFSAANQLKLLCLRMLREKQNKVKPLRQQQAIASATESGAHKSRKSIIEKKEKKKEKKKESTMFLACFWWIDNYEIAERFTIIEFDMYRRIEERELLNLNWKKETPDFPSVNVLEFIARFNNVGFWIATEIVKPKDVNQRAKLIERYLDLADTCLQIRNYNSMMEVLSGLNHFPVGRLKKTWEKVGSRYTELMKKLEDFMDTKKNYKNYRAALQAHRASNTFALPYLGVYLRDLTFIEEGVEAKIQEQVNLEKVFLVANILDEIKSFQCKELKITTKYAPDENPTVYLKTLSGLSEEELEKISKDREPLKIPNPLPNASPKPQSTLSTGANSLTSSTSSPGIAHVGAGSTSGSASERHTPSEHSTSVRSDRSSSQSQSEASESSHHDSNRSDGGQQLSHVLHELSLSPK